MTLVWARRSLLATASVLLLAACTDARPVDRPAATAARTAPASPSTPSPSLTSHSSPRQQPTQPLVIVTHMTRPPYDISEAMARRLIRGDVTTWAELGSGSGPLRLVSGPGTPAPDVGELGSARAAVRAVTRHRDSVAVVPAVALGPQVRAVTVGGVSPVRRPNAYPLRAPATTRAEPVVTLTVTGDIMLGRGVAERAKGSGDPTVALRSIAARLASTDITVGNLESTLSRAGAPTQGDDSFAADPAVVGGLRAAGFDVLGLANNHVGDFGDGALVQTVRRLRTAGLATFGAGADARGAWRPAVLERAGVRFGFLGFNAIGETPSVGRHQPGAVSVNMPPRTGPLDHAKLGRFEKAVRRLDRVVDVVVVMPHWGTQYTNQPEPVQRLVANRLVSAGADVVVGGHPHWVQGAETIRGRLVVHSLGNFVFDMDFMDETQRGLLLELTYWGDALKAADFVPYRMDRRFAPVVQSHEDGLDTLRLMWAASGPAFRG